jgi:hypothetical protein
MARGRTAKKRGRVSLTTLLGALIEDYQREYERDR